MSFYHLPNPYNPGYALPEYVKAEPPGRGTFTTAWLPRGTISELVPDYLAQPEGKKPAHTLTKTSLSGSSLTGSSLTGNSLAGSSLGNDATGAAVFDNYGKKTAASIMKILATVPAKDRSTALKTALNKIDRGLWPQVAHAKSRAALQRSLAKALSAGVAKEIVSLGKGKRPKGQLAQKPLSGSILGSITGVVSKITGAVGSATCQLANSPTLSLAAGAAAASQGSSPNTGMMGASAAQQLCMSGQQPGMYPGYYGQQQTPWLPILLVGGGALALIMVLK